MCFKLLFFSFNCKIKYLETSEDLFKLFKAGLPKRPNLRGIGGFLVREGKGEWQYSKKRVTSMKGNSRVILPKIMKKFRDEAALETMRTEVMQDFLEFIRKNCNKRGEQCSNLSNSELRGLKSLKKRVKNGEIVVVPTDKTGKLCVMAREAYEEAGSVHVGKDEKVGQEEVDRIDGEVNGNISLLIKFFRLGKGWNQTGRMRESLITGSQSICPLYLHTIHKLFLTKNWAKCE